MEPKSNILANTSETSGSGKNSFDDKTKTTSKPTTSPIKSGMVHRAVNTGQSKNASPSGIQLSDYSPFQKSNLIASFSTPPGRLNVNGNGNSPQSAQSVISKIQSQLSKTGLELNSGSESDLTVSEDEKEIQPKFKKPRALPINFEDDSDDDEKETEPNISKEKENENEKDNNSSKSSSSSGSSNNSSEYSLTHTNDNSLIISLPSSSEEDEIMFSRQTDSESDSNDSIISIGSDQEIALPEPKTENIPKFTNSPSRIAQENNKASQSVSIKASPIKTQPIDTSHLNKPEKPILSENNLPAQSLTSQNSSNLASIASNSTINVIAAPVAVSTALKASHSPQSNKSPLKTGYVYDERMLLHFDPHDSSHPENPGRISAIYEKLRAARLLEKSQKIPITVKIANLFRDLILVHDSDYCKRVNQTPMINSLEGFLEASSQFNSVYIGPSTALSASVAAAATLELCNSIACGDIENGYAIIRPPGHHAEHDEAMGFCFYNNVAVAAASLIHHKLAQRVLILDWDVHHGNGTQNAFVESPDVLYISIHRHDFGSFYPHMDEASHSFVGVGAGLGKSVNVAWNGPGYGDADYLYAFSRLIMPIAREFNPDLVIVSAGFDAAAGDPIGECELSAYGYSMMLQELLTLAGGKLALVLEGGYNLDVISTCYEACVRTLLKEAPPRSNSSLVASAKAVSAVENSVLSQSKYWKCLFPKPSQLASSGSSKTVLSDILDRHWMSECKMKFNLSPAPGLFSSCDAIYEKIFLNRILISESVLFNPEVLIVFAHESGPVFSNSFVSTLCLSQSKIHQNLPYIRLLESATKAKYGIIDINVPAKSWKVKQSCLGYENDTEQLKYIFNLLWDRIIQKSSCKKVFFVASGFPIYSIGNLFNVRAVESQVRGCFFFSSSLFLPVMNQANKAEWYKNTSFIVVPSQEPLKKKIPTSNSSFGSCYSAGQWLLSDSSAVVDDFNEDILNFIQTKI